MNGVQLLLVIIAAIAVSGLANRSGLQAPLVVVIVGLAASFIPDMPRLEVQPDIILGLVLPPLLYSTALDFSFPSFIRNLAPILRLGVGLVLISAFTVAGVATWVVPGLGFGAALVLGAVVAPPDAVTAVAIGRKLGVPRRVMAILTGESLVNDAAALTLFSVGVAAVTGTHNVVDNPFLFFGYTSLVGVLVGLALGILVQWLRGILHDPGLETVLGLIVPFAAYLLAEELHGSGVLAVVLAGFSLGHNSATAGFATRLQERQLWSSLDVLLEAFVFAYMGLQLRFVIDDARGQGEPIGRILVASLILLLVVIAIRPLWVVLVFSGRRLIHYKISKASESAGRPPKPLRNGTWQSNALISWTGMRGVVTLAAASGIPLTTATGQDFPERASIQLIAFVVAIGTLLIQGPTLPRLVRWLNISTEREQTARQQERLRARQISDEASLQAVQELLADPPDGVDPTWLSTMAERLRQAQETRANFAPGNDPSEHEEARKDLARAIRLLRQRMLNAQRTALVKERDAGSLDDEVLRDVLAQLDYEEAATATSSSSRL